MSINVAEVMLPKSYEELKSAYLALEKRHVKEIKDLEIHYKEKLKVAYRLAYGQKADVIYPSLFNEAEVFRSEVGETEETEEEKVDVKAHSKKKAKRKPLPDHLPREVVNHDLDESQRICQQHGTKMHKIGEVVTEELHYQPAKLKVVEHHQAKYGCRSCDGHFKTAAKPEKIIPKSFSSPSLLSHIMISKYQDHLPLYRQEKIFERHGIALPRHTMASWMITLGEKIQPLVNLMIDDLLDGPHVHCDETPVLVLSAQDHPGKYQSYMWVLGRWGPHGSIVVFDYDQSRSSAVAKRLLSDYRGYLQVDGYKAYDALEKVDSGITRVGCLAHVRRQFVNCLKDLKPNDRRRHAAFPLVQLIAELYEIEREISECSEEERLSIRKNRSSGVFDKLSNAVKAEIVTVAPKSQFGRALAYAMTELPRIRHYLDQGFLQIDNNKIENAIRPFALGRKNWLFADTEHGARASANIFSLIETAKANRRDLVAYLNRVLVRLPYCRTIEDYEALLPYSTDN